MPFRPQHDVLIVGARCAGATLAVLLARAGASVLVLDKDRLPSDQILSTHTVHPPGLDVLDQVGVGDEIRRVAPASRTMRLRKNEAVVDVPFAQGRAEHCPRRKRLDGLLQDAARAAGVDLRDRTRATSLLVEGERVVGVRATGPGGDEHELHARLVVGADGRHSTVARLVQAEEYLGYDSPRAMYWGYWNAPASWHDPSEYPFDMYVGKTGRDARVIFQTDDDQLLIGSLPPVAEAMAWRSDAENALRANLASDATTARLVGESVPEGGVRGTLRERYFFRRGAGPGWALVGDAGHHKEFIIGDGITEALIQARSLAEAISEGADEALARWWRARDVEALPMFFFGQDEGAPSPPRTLEEVVFSRAGRSAQLRSRMAYVMEHLVSPYDVFPAGLVVRWMLAAALRGSPRVVADFAAIARRGAKVGREMRRRRRLLDAAGAQVPARAAPRAAGSTR